MSEMIEAVARSICRHYCQGDVHPCDVGNDGLCKPEACREWEHRVPAARAAIAAMREPDRCVVKGMCKAMSPEHRPTFEWVSAAEKHRIRWRAAIDRVLADGEAA